MNLRLSTLLLAMVAAAGLPGPATAQQQLARPDAAVLADTGTVFPGRLGNFVRAGVVAIGPGRIDAHYVLPGGGPGSTSVDIYVVRVGEPLAEEFATTESVIRTMCTDIVAVRDLPAPAAAPGAIGRLWRGSLQGAPVLTGMILFHRDGWRIKLRATVPAGRGEEGWADVNTLIEAFGWTVSRV